MGTDNDDCPVCGGRMCGDGYNTLRCCENTDADMWGLEPDAGPIYCDANINDRDKNDNTD